MPLSVLLAAVLFAATPASTPGTGSATAKAKSKSGKSKKKAKPAAPAAEPESPAPAPAPTTEAPKPAEPAPADPPRAAQPAEPLETPKPAAPPKSTATPTRVAVLDPQVTGGVPERALAAFLQSLLPELRKLQGVSAIGMGEVRDMLAFEKQRQLLGCGDEGCLAEIGGALGVDELVTVQLSLAGSKYSLSMKRMNLRRAKVVQSEQKVFDKRDGEELLAVVGPMVEALYPDRELKQGKARGVEAAVVKRLNPPPLPRWVFAGTGVAAAVAAGAGGAFSLLQNKSYSEWRAKKEEALQSSVQGADLVRLQRETETNRKNALIFYGISGGLVVAAVVEAFFTDWHNDRVALSAGPTGVGVSGTF